MGFIKAESQTFAPVGSSEEGGRDGQFAYLPYSGFDHIHPSDLAKSGSSDGRSKVARACTECKSRKMRCDGGLPFCGRCTTHSRTKSCAYVDPPKRSPITRQYVSSLEEQLEAAKQTIASLEASHDTHDHAAHHRRPSMLPHNRSLTGDVVTLPHLTSKKRTRTSSSLPEDHCMLSDGFDSNEDNKDDIATKEDLFKGSSFVSLSSCDAALQIASQLGVGRQTLADHAATQRNITNLDVSCESLSKASCSTFTRPVNASMLLLSNANCASWDNESRNVASSLLDSFFEFHHPSYPILHPPTFRAQLDGSAPNTPGWLMLVNMVFALGAFERKTSAQESIDDEHFFQVAKNLYSAVIFGQADMIAVQALTLMANYCQKKNFFSNAWTVLGSAVRMAISLGLHSESALQSKGMSAFDMEFGRRLWYALFTMEADTCISMARPNGLLSINADVAQPKNVRESAMSPSCAELPAEVDEATISSTLCAHAKFASDVSMPLQARLMQSSNPTIEEIREFDLKTEDFVDKLPAYMAEDYAESKPVWLSLASSRLRWRCNNFRMVMYRPFLLSTSVAAAAARHCGDARPTLRPAVKQAVALCRQMASNNIHSISEFWDLQPHNQAMAWHAIYFLTQSAIVPLVSLLDEPNSPDAVDWVGLLQTSVRLLSSMGEVTPIGAKCKDAIQALAGDLINAPADVRNVSSLSKWMSSVEPHVNEVDNLMWSAHLMNASNMHPADPSLGMSVDSVSSDGASVAAFDFVRGSPSDGHQAGSWPAGRLSTSSQWSDHGSNSVPDTEQWYGSLQQPGSSHADDVSLFGTSEPSSTALAAPPRQEPPRFEWHHTTDPASWWNMQYKNAQPATYVYPQQQQQQQQQFRSTVRPQMQHHVSHEQVTQLHHHPQDQQHLHQQHSFY